MGRPEIFPLSGETRALLKRQNDFFRAVSQLHGQTQVNLRGTDSEARIERVEENGEIQVSFVYPLDDNANAVDGRIYLRDRFTFGSAKEEFRSFERSFEYGGQDSAWLARLRLFQDFEDPAKNAVGKFSREVARRYTGASPWHSFEPGQIQALKARQDYLLQAVQIAVDVNTSWRLKITDTQTRYTIHETPDATQVTLTFVVDDDSDSVNGRIWLEENFTLDKTTRQLKNYSRKWRLGPDVVSTPKWDTIVSRLNQTASPGFQEAGEFIQSILKSLPLPLPAPPAKFSVFSAHASARREAVGKQRLAAEETLAFLEEVERERLEKREDGSKGWLSGGTTDTAGRRALTEKIFLKAKQAASTTEAPRSALEILGSLSLEPEAARLRDEWLGDPLFKKIDEAGQEPDPALRGDQFLHLGRHDLLSGGLFQATRALAGKYQVGPSAEKAKALLASLEGNTGFGERFETFAGHTVTGLSSPTAMAAMVLAGSTGPAAELLGLRLLGRFGSAGRFGAATLGTSVESLAFTSFHKIGQSLGHDPDRVFANFWRDGVATAWLLGGMRLAHAGAGQLSLRGAEAAWAQKAGLSRAVPAGEAAFTTAHERILLNVPKVKLTRRGEIMNAGLAHVSGITGMLGAAGAARHLDLQDGNSQVPSGMISDTLLFYLQATVGFHLANRLTGGEWLRFLGEMKWRQKNLYDRPVKFGRITDQAGGDKRRLPTTELFDVSLASLNQPHGEGAQFRLEPNHQIYLDRIFLGQGGKKIQLSVNNEGSPFLWDGRKPRSFPRILQKFLPQAEDTSLPLLVNSLPVPKEKWWRLKDADLISFSTKHFGVGALYQAPLKQQVFKLPAEDRQALKRLFKESNNVSDLVQNLKASSLPLASELLTHLIEVFQGKEPLQSLPAELLPETKELMALEVREVRNEYPIESSSLKAPLQNPRWSPLENDYQKAKALGRLAFQIRQSGSLQDLREYLQRGPLGKIEGYDVEALADKILRIEQGRENGLQDLPPSLGIRQRVRDLLEQSVYQEFTQKQYALPSAPFHSDFRIQAEMNRLQELRAQLYRKLDHVTEFHTPDRIYHQGEIKELLDQVLERGKPLVLLPDRYGFRQEAEAYLREVEACMRLFFPMEMQATVNPFTGELIYPDFRESSYRLALHTFHHYSGQPVLGIPTIKEVERLGNLVMTYLGADSESDFVLDQAQLRQHLDHGSPQALRMLRQATPAEKALIIDTYFGGYRRRDVPAATAFQLAVLMGESGVYREVGVTYEFNDNSMRPTLSLGDLHFVSPQRRGDFFAIHTHPELYLAPGGQIMGIGPNGGGMNDYQQKTMILFGDGLKISSDTGNILPSDQDLEIFLSDAKRYWQAAYHEKFRDSPLFDHGRRAYQNWVIHSWGGSEVKIGLDKSGTPAGVKIRYAFKGEVDPEDGTYQHSIQRLSRLAARMKIPIQFEPISYRELRDGLPFNVPSLSGYYFHFKKSPALYTVGRNSQLADGVILDKAVSESHLEFVHRDGTWMVADAGSSNGTKLNNVPIHIAKGQRGPWHSLQDWDVLSIGRLKLRFSKDEFDDGMNLTQVLD